MACEEWWAMVQVCTFGITLFTMNTGNQNVPKFKKKKILVFSTSSETHDKLCKEQETFLTDQHGIFSVYCVL